MARNMSKIFSPVTSKKPVTRENRLSFPFTKYSAIIECYFSKYFIPLCDMNKKTAHSSHSQLASKTITCNIHRCKFSSQAKKHTWTKKSGLVKCLRHSQPFNLNIPRSIFCSIKMAPCVLAYI